MIRTKKVLCVLLAMLMIVPMTAGLFTVYAATTYTKASTHSYQDGDAVYSKYTLVGNNGNQANAYVLECDADDYLMMVYSGYSGSSSVLKGHYDKAVAAGYDVVGMINGSFFSMDTNYGCYGRLVEYDVVNGELVMGDHGNAADAYDGAVCITSDGKVSAVKNSQLAFHLAFNGVEVKGGLGTVNKTGGSKLKLENGNYIDNWSNLFYYFDSNCDGAIPTYTTLTATDGTTRELSGYEIVCQKTTTTGLRIDGTLYGVIKEIKKGGAGSVLADDEFALFVRKTSPYMSLVETLRVGDEVSVGVEETVAAAKGITSQANSITENVNYLVKDGVNLTLNTTTFNKTAAHSATYKACWAALGVKADGSYVLFNSDGKVTPQDVATMMLDGLGCKTVIRMDGGGSTAMYLKDTGSGSAGYAYNQGRKVPDVIMIVRRSTSPALQGKARENLETFLADTRINVLNNTYGAEFNAAYDKASALLADATSVSGDYGRVLKTLEDYPRVYAGLAAACEKAAGADEMEYTARNWKCINECVALAETLLNGSFTLEAASQILQDLNNALAAIGDHDVNVSAGASYTSNPSANATYPDTGMKELTDGDYGNPSEADGSAWCGYGSGTPEIVVDLGAETAGLTRFNAHFLNMNSWGIRVPASVAVSVSSDNKTFTAVGTSAPSLTEAQLSVDSVVYDYTVTSAQPLTARYVKFTITRRAWTFISEVEIYAHEKAKKNLPLPETGTVVVDGELDDDGWQTVSWASFDETTATDQAAVTIGTLGGEYAYLVDNGWLYVAFKYNNPITHGNGNGKSTNLRTWIRANTESSVYTHFYDVYVNADGVVSTLTKYNTILTGNKAADIADSTFVAAVNETTGVIEYKVNLAELGSPELLELRFGLSDVVGEGGKNVSVLYPPVWERGVKNFPYNKWVDGAILIGEIPCEHSLTYHALQEPTCTENGSLAYYLCELCGKKYANVHGLGYVGETVISALGHTAGDWAVVKDPAIEVPGRKEQRCTVCDALLDSEEIPALSWSTAYEYISENGEITITKYIGSDTEITIPATIDGLPVATIGDNAFMSAKITSLVIPEGVKTIGDYAFYDCYCLTSVSLPGTLVHIGRHAFAGCDVLASVEIPDSVTELGIGAFTGCMGLTKAVLPKGLKTIPAALFASCYALTDIEIPNGVTVIESQAFQRCTSLAEIVIPDSVLVIEYEAFFYCTALTSVVIPADVQTLGRDVFTDCEGLKDIYCEALAQPTGWDNNWNRDCNATVHWNYSAVTPDIMLDIEDGTVMRGQSYDLTVSISGNPGISGFLFNVVYDHAVLELTGVDTPEGTAYRNGDCIGWASATGYAGDGVLMTLHFTVLEEAPIGLTVVKLAYEEGDVRGNNGEQPVVKVFSGVLNVLHFHILGDADGDGELGAHDSIMLLRYLIEAEELADIEEGYMDLDGNGETDIYDVVLLLRYLADMITSFPVQG